MTPQIWSEGFLNQKFDFKNSALNITLTGPICYGDFGKGGYFPFTFRVNEPQWQCQRYKISVAHGSNFENYRLLYILGKTKINSMPYIIFLAIKAN